MLIFAPPFGCVVLIQTLPVGAGDVSEDLNSGTLVCGAICTLGAEYVPAVKPKFATSVPLPSAILTVPVAVVPEPPSSSIAVAST